MDKKFINNFERRVFCTIKRFKLINKGEKVGIALSGGKDSSSLLAVLSKKYNVKAILVDEGTVYRKKLLKNAKRITERYGVELKVYTFKKEYGHTLPEFLKISKKKGLNLSPCTICSTLRKALLNDASIKEGIDVLATGHNMDDEAQSIIMSIMRGNPEFLQRIGPRSNKIEGFVPRIKPFYLTKEKDIMAYAIINGLIDKEKYLSCPYSPIAYRNTPRKILDKIESEKRVKRKIIEGFLKLKKYIKTQKEEIDYIKKCKICGMPSSGDICSRCKILLELNEE